MDIKNIAKKAIRESLNNNGFHNKKDAHIFDKEKTLKKENTTIKKVVTEAHVVTPKSFHLNTERLSNSTKRAHERLYNGYVDKFNKSSSALDAASQQEANSNSSQYRSLSNDRTYNLNAIKLHELYFYNISDLSSEIGVNSVPFMRLSRDFGSFEKWQFDFMAAAKSSREGWAIVVYEPYKNCYMNIVVDSHNINIPINTIPVLVLDMWSHSYYDDYQDNKDDYIVAMMREINWDIVEARMAIAEKSDLDGLYHIQPLYNTAPQEMINNIPSHPPIETATQNQNNHNIIGDYNEKI